MFRFSSALFQLNNKDIGTILAVRSLAQLVFPVGRKHEKSPILRDISPRGRPEPILSRAVSMGEAPDFRILAIRLGTIDLIFPGPGHVQRSTRGVWIAIQVG